jgi:hypothetical protein
MHIVLLLLVTIVACDRPGPSAATPPTPTHPVATTGDAAVNRPIAQYLGADDATGHRVLELLHAAGIDASAGGSIGYSVWVEGGIRRRRGRSCRRRLTANA